MTVARRRAATQSPTAGKSDVRERREAEPAGDRGRPVARAVADDRGLAMDGDDPRRATASATREGALGEASAQPASQPSGRSSGAGSRVIVSRPA